MYTFNKEMYMQEDGGSIGERFTQALARVEMLDWDKQFLELAKKNKVNMLLYSRYVDDGNQGLTSLPLGSRWCEQSKKFIIKEDLVDQDAHIPADKRSLMEIIKMGNSINPMIQLTGDCPSSNPNAG